MKETGKKDLLAGVALLAAFTLWTLLIQLFDLQPAGPDGTIVGFAAFNLWFHHLTGVHFWLYTITDWLGLVPILICLCFAGLGVIQLAKRRSLLEVDADIIFLGLYYLLVVFCYLFFEMVPINYRPILINGNLEASYPSSTTLLVLSVMPTLKLQIDRRSADVRVRKTAVAFVVLFSSFMVLGRLLAGVHWATDIMGSVLLSSGLFLLYRAVVSITDQKRKNRRWGNEHGIQ